MTTGATTIHTAPRVLHELEALGPFMLKTLMQQATRKLSYEWSDAQKQAFMRDPVNKRAEDVLGLLQQIDAGGGAEETATPPPPVAAAAVRREPAPARSPAPNGVAHAPSDGDMPNLSGMGELLREVSESQKGVATMLGEVNKTLKESNSLKKDIGALTGQMTQLFRLQHLTLGVIAQLAEQQLNAPFKDILEQVAEEYGNIEPVVQGLVSGK